MKPPLPSPVVASSPTGIRHSQQPGHPALPAAAHLEHGHAAFYPYPVPDLAFMELPPPTGRDRHPVWQTDAPIISVDIRVWWPDGTTRSAHAHEKLPLADYDLERAAMHLAMTASHQIRK